MEYDPLYSLNIFLPGKGGAISYLMNVYNIMKTLKHNIQLIVWFNMEMLLCSWCMFVLLWVLIYCNFRMMHSIFVLVPIINSYLFLDDVYHR